MARISSGVYGLDQIIEGGFITNTVNCILGGTGTGKTTFGIQYLLEGARNGQHGLYITMEENPENLIREAKAMGLNEIEQRVDEGQILFKKVWGGEVAKFFQEELPTITRGYSENFDVESRIFIDPLTPFLNEVKERSRQRKILSEALQSLRELGTILISVEDPGGIDLGVTEEVATPLYISDSIVHLQYMAYGGIYNRTMKIIKFRGTDHGEEVYPFSFIRGLGLVTMPYETEQEKHPRHTEKFDELIEEIEKKTEGKRQQILKEKINKAKEKWYLHQEPDHVLEEFKRKYNLDD